MENILYPLRMGAALLRRRHTKVLSKPRVPQMMQTFGHTIVKVSRVVFVLVTLRQRLSDLAIERDRRFSPGHLCLLFGQFGLPRGENRRASHIAPLIEWSMLALSSVLASFQ